MPPYGRDQPATVGTVGVEVSTMDDIKKTYREGENKTKEAFRKADGENVVLHDLIG